MMDTVVKFLEFIITHWITIAILVVLGTGIVLFYLRKKKKEQFDFNCYVQIVELYNGSLKASPIIKAKTDPEKNNLIIMFSANDQVTTRLPNVSECGILYKDAFLLKLLKSANQENTYYPMKLKIPMDDTDENGVPDIFESPIRIEDMAWYENLMRDKLMKHRPHAAYERYIKLMALLTAVMLVASMILVGYATKKMVGVSSGLQGSQNKINENREKELELNTRLLDFIEDQQKEQNLNINKPPD